MKAAVSEKEAKQQIESRERAPLRRRVSVDSAMRLPERVPSPFYIGLTVGSIVASVALFAKKRKEDALFVGLWAPTFLALGAFAELLGTRRDRRGEPEA